MIYDALTSFVPSIGLPESIETPIYYVAYVLLAFPVLRTAARNILKGEIFDENFLMSIATLGAIAIDALPEAVGVNFILTVSVNSLKKKQQIVAVQKS